jgi:hypothetical protein
LLQDLEVAFVGHGNLGFFKLEYATDASANQKSSSPRRMAAGFYNASSRWQPEGQDANGKGLSSLRGVPKVPSW